MKVGSPASRSRNFVLMAAASCCGLPLERTTSQASVEGDCRIDKNIAGRRSSVMFGEYFPSPTMPTTWTRVPPASLKYAPSALSADPNTLPANSRFTTATGGALLSSWNVSSLPAKRGVLAAKKYSGEMLNFMTRAAAFPGRRSAVVSVKIFDSLQQAASNGGMLTNPTDVTPEIEPIAATIRVCIAGTPSAL